MRKKRHDIPPFYILSSVPKERRKRQFCDLLADKDGQASVLFCSIVSEVSVLGAPVSGIGSDPIFRVQMPKGRDLSVPFRGEPTRPKAS